MLIRTNTVAQYVAGFSDSPVSVCDMYDYMSCIKRKSNASAISDCLHVPFQTDKLQKQSRPGAVLSNSTQLPFRPYGLHALAF